MTFFYLHFFLDHIMHSLKMKFIYKIVWFPTNTISYCVVYALQSMIHSIYDSIVTKSKAIPGG